jgi:hypothetical protein
MSGNVQPTDPRLEELKRQFEFETDEELSRKRQVYLSHIVNHTQDEIEETRKDIDFNKSAYAMLSEIAQAREKAAQSRQKQELYIKWIGLGVSFLAGVVVTAILKD